MSDKKHLFAESDWKRIVGIVTCSECAHGRGICGQIVCTENRAFNRLVNPDHFCGFAVRKENHGE